MIFFHSAGDDDSKPGRADRRPLLLSVMIALAVGAVDSIFIRPNIEGWYGALNHPSFAPPDWLFAPVWTALYVLMGAAAWRAWRVTGTRSPAMTTYGVQLFLNFCWGGIFFGLHRMGLALGEIILLALAILVTLILFWRADRLAGLMMAPYLAWTGFAAVLNYAFLALNP